MTMDRKNPGISQPKPQFFGLGNGEDFGEPRDGFRKSVQIGPQSFEIASVGGHAATMIDSLARRGKNVSLKDLHYD